MSISILGISFLRLDLLTAIAARLLVLATTYFLDFGHQTRKFFCDLYFFFNYVHT